LSNPIPFTVNTLQITGVSPGSGVSGTSVAITGSGFGSSQGTGAVILGGAISKAVSWSDTQIQTFVSSTAVTGVVRVQQNGAWSNTLPFTVPGAGAAARLAPNLLNMAVGDTHTIQALNAAGKPVTGLVWTSSDPTIVSLSTDDPPVLTALAIGHATISAGGSSADVTVSPTLALGTILWSNPGDGSGVYKIVPAVPSSSGVADVFAFQNDGTVEAITSDSITAWTAAANSDSVPDFQGGLIVRHYDPNTNSYSIQKLDGATGLPYPPYSLGPYHELLVHPDGTVFAVDGNEVVAVDPIGGTSKFTIPVPGNYPASGIDFVQPIIAGDGYTYVPFVYRGSDCINVSLDMLRVSSTGAYDRIPVITRPTHSCEWEGIVANVITNADTGVLLSWKSTDYLQSSNAATYGMAIISGTAVSMANAPQVPSQSGPVIPILQAEDGSYIGTVRAT
jgi:hypothetical protein